MGLPGRNEKGQFIKGYSGGPGRPQRAVEEEYRAILVSTVTKSDWQAIIVRAVADAKRGDSQARKWLSDYLIGPPVERKELTGQDGGPVSIIEIIRDSANTLPDEE